MRPAGWPAAFATLCLAWGAVSAAGAAGLGPLSAAVAPWIAWAGAQMQVQIAQGPAGPPVSQGAAPMITGDLIVKFRDASEPGAQLAGVLAGQRTVASVAPLAVRLSSELGVALTLVQVTSGREALLALDREALARELLARAGREATVQRAALAAPAAPGSLPGAELVLKLEMRGSTPAPARDALAARLAVGALERPRVVAQGVGAGGVIHLRYDLDALTLALIAKLKQHREVEYVQANRLLRPQPAAGGGPSSAPR